MLKKKALNIPNHIAIIMDGNARWAKKRLLPRVAGYKKGIDIAEKVIYQAMEAGVKYLTLFAFSSENWFRPKIEVEELMGLFRSYLKNVIPNIIKRDIKVIFIGERDKLDEDIKGMMKEVEDRSSNNKFNLILAVSYGGRDEIRTAAIEMAKYLKDKKLSEYENSLFDSFINNLKIPDPDLLIRTSGEHRISNFLLWQIAYTELYFTDKLWPDFCQDDLHQAIISYSNRERRYGR